MWFWQFLANFMKEKKNPRRMQKLWEDKISRLWKKKKKSVLNSRPKYIVSGNKKKPDIVFISQILAFSNQNCRLDPPSKNKSVRSPWEIRILPFPATSKSETSFLSLMTRLGGRPPRMGGGGYCHVSRQNVPPKTPKKKI